MKKKVFWILYIAFLAVPAITIWQTADSSTFSDTANLPYFVLRVFGLYGLTLIAIQTLLGAFMPFFIRNLGPWVRKFHIFQGIFAYLLILLHPIMYSLFELPHVGIIKTFVDILPHFSTSFEVYMDLGKLAFILLSVGVAAGLLRNNPKVIAHWRLVHRANYLVFAIVMLHSWLIGSDTHIAPFVYMYPVFIAILIASVWYKWNQYKRVKSLQMASKQAPEIPQSNKRNKSK
jgi:DMSO/TMAO reductase YedYZ heme-binding membrane subunit